MALIIHRFALFFQSKSDQIYICMVSWLECASFPTQLTRQNIDFMVVWDGKPRIIVQSFTRQQYFLVVLYFLSEGQNILFVLVPEHPCFTVVGTYCAHYLQTKIQKSHLFIISFLNLINLFPIQGKTTISQNEVGGGQQFLRGWVFNFLV